MMVYRRREVGTKVLTTEIEFAHDSEDLDTEVRIPEASTLCWISRDDIGKFTKELQELITKFSI